MAADAALYALASLLLSSSIIFHVFAAPSSLQSGLNHHTTSKQQAFQIAEISESHVDPAGGGWADPRIGGGRMIDYTTPRRGEPLNVIISGLSDEHILTDDGLREYSKSIGFSSECLGLHYGNIHNADLGDGLGQHEEQYLARQWYLHPIYGTCWESIVANYLSNPAVGGNHFRAWKQNGTNANTDAWFLAVSKEMFIGKNHEIAPNGYNLGRDWLVERATKGGEWEGMKWKADLIWLDHLLEPGSKGINHGIAQDGRVALLTVRRVDDMHTQSS